MHLRIPFASSNRKSGFMASQSSHRTQKQKKHPPVCYFGKATDAFLGLFQGPKCLVVLEIIKVANSSIVGHFKCQPPASADFDAQSGTLKLLFDRVKAWNFHKCFQIPAAQRQLRKQRIELGSMMASNAGNATFFGESFEPGMQK